MVRLPASLVAITFSPQSSIAHFVKELLIAGGVPVDGAFSSVEDLEQHVRDNKPAVIVYDVSFPFAANWAILQDLRRRPAFRDISIVVTTSESRALFRAVGCATAVELFARPNDVQALASALRRELESASAA
jgi:CheY-like chemotaxis protein